MVAVAISPSSSRWRAFLVACARSLFELPLIVTLFYGADSLGRLRISVPGFVAFIVAVVAAMLLARVVEVFARLPRGLTGCLEVLGAVVGVLAVDQHLAKGGFTLQQGLAMVGVTAVAVTCWRAWLDRSVRKGLSVWAESSRLVLLWGVGFTVSFAFFTDLFVGGVDARWYAYMLVDYLEQLRAGIWPIWVGQGEFAFNGGVHPFRSAPIFMGLAGVWDFLTVRSLSPVALQHLTAITASFASCLGCYAAVLAIAPDRRWLALLTAVLFATCPGVLTLLYTDDMYMSYLASAVLPWVAYGNIKALREEGTFSFAVLACALAILWRCHPPLALQGTALSAFFQAGRLLLQPAGVERWRAATVGAVLFAGLSVGYFVGMSEIPPPSKISPARELMIVTGAALGLVAVVRGAIWGQGAGWLCSIPAAWLLWKGEPVLFYGWAGAQILAGGVAGWARKRAWFDPRAFGLEILVSAALIMAVILGWWKGPAFAGGHPTGPDLLKINASLAKAFLLPVSPFLTSPGDKQPGWGLLVLACIAGLSWIRRGELGQKLFFVAVVGVLLTLFRVPWVSDVLVAYVPIRLLMTAGIPLPIRMVPTLAMLAAFGGFWWLATRARPTKGVWRGVAVVAGMLLGGWAVWQGSHVLNRAKVVTSDRAITTRNFLTENAVLDRYAFDLLLHPAYFSHGKQDPRLENRLLHRNQTRMFGHEETAARMEEAWSKRIPVTSRVHPTGPDWLMFEPKISVAPGERLLLRFEFLDKNYSGHLMFNAPAGHREYQLPQSGLSMAFGIDVVSSHVLSLWNSTREVQDYEVTMLPSPGNTLPRDGGQAMSLTLSRYDPELTAVRLESFIPYRATVRLEQPGYLETMRAWLPGYRATVDGENVPVERSIQSLLMIPLEPGVHQVELRYVGTPFHWCGLVVSWTTWLGVAAGWWWRRRLPRAQRSRPAAALQPND